MSGGMGYYGSDMYDDGEDQYGDPSGQAAQQERKNPLREHLNKVEARNSDLEKKVEQLMAQQRRNVVADELQAKGYDRAAAGLYGGDPEKLDEWLGTYGQMLAKQPTDTSVPGSAQQQAGPPASTVPAEGQAAMQQIQQAGLGAAAPGGSEVEQIAHMNQANTAEELMEFLRSQGNPYHWNG